MSSTPTPAPSRLELEKRSALVDALVQSSAAAHGLACTVVAVGGYGRRELFPFSDVDLLLLVDDLPPPGPGRDAIAAFIRALWDNGLRASQSVHTVEECCQIHDGNLELTISLLDRRAVCGPAARFDSLQERFPRFLAAERSGILRHLARMTRARHDKFGGTIFHLEPNIKECPGGLRDLHVLHWLRALGAASGNGLDEARDFLARIRLFLHARSGRDNNLLNFEAQEAIAADPAAWMREYYRHARGVFRAVRRALEQAEDSGAGLLASFRDWRGRLSNAEFTVSRERVLLREPGLLASDPSAVFRLLEFVARHGLALAPDTEQRLAAALPALASRPSYPWKDVRALFALPRCAHALRLLQDAGLLAVFLPEWKRIDALVARDFYHRYTVDEHTLVALESLAALAGAHEAPRRRFAHLLDESAGLAALRLALLLHDIGKGGGAGEHTAASVRIASEVLARFQTPEPVRDTVLFLIERHLDLSSVINSRDLEDPATARHAAARTGSIERLRLLTLMTYADISAVNPTALSPWRLDQLWRLYTNTHHELTRELQSDRIHHAEADAETAAFLEGIPTRYLRTHAPAEIAAHVALARQAGRSGAAASVARDGGYFRAAVVSPDRPGLLASLSGILASFGLEIAQAEASANASGLGLNTFAFSDPHRTLELNPSEVDRLSGALVEAALGRLDPRSLLRNRPRPAAHHRPAAPAAVSFDDSASENATLVEISAPDRPGLLYDLAVALASDGLNIEVVLINTEAHRAFDVFYVTRAGAKLDEAGRESLRARLLEACRPA